MIQFIDEQREWHSVESICSMLLIAPSTYRRHAAMIRDPSYRSYRSIQDEEDLAHICWIFDESGRRYGSRKVYHQLQREDVKIAKCTVERLMKTHGLQGVVRGKRVITTNPDTSQPCPDDRVNRQFVASRPNQLWVSDFTYVSTWSGMVYVAFVIDVFARRIVGWSVSTSMTTQFVLDALNQAIHQRLPANDNALIHHSDRGSQYLSIRYTDRLAEQGIDASVGSVGDSYDNALAETTIGLYKTEVTNFMGPWKSMTAVGWETAKWVEWYNSKRIHSAIDYITPKQAEEAYFGEQKMYDQPCSKAA